jgi:hypothetical protein
MKAPVNRSRPASGTRSQLRTFGRVSGNASYLKTAQKAIGGGGEPTGMTRLQNHRARVKFSHGGEEFVSHPLFEGKLGRKLNQHRSQLLAEPLHRTEEIQQITAGVYKLRGMSNCLWRFHGKATIVWCGGRPPFPRRAPMRPVKARIYFRAGKTACIAIKMRELENLPGIGKKCQVLFRHRPTCRTHKQFHSASIELVKALLIEPCDLCHEIVWNRVRSLITETGILLIMTTKKATKKNSLVNNINRRKKSGTSRSKKQSTVSKSSYQEMQSGWSKK